MLLHQTDSFCVEERETAMATIVSLVDQGIQYLFIYLFVRLNIVLMLVIQNTL